MNRAAEWVKEEFRARGHSTLDVKKGFAEWLRFAPQYWQDWGDLFPRPGIDYTILTHVKAYLGYFFVKLYQTMNQKRIHKASDLYDQGYFVESTTLGNLATCDGDLIRTINLVPDNAVMVHDAHTWI